MTNDQDFEDIRPYRDEEIPAAMQRIAASPFFPLIAEFVFPESTVEQARSLVAGLTTTDEFQHKVMYFANKQIINRTIDEFSVGGMERLDTAERYLFMSNHRDIMLDASLLQSALDARGHRSTQITFGSNLMQGQTVIDIGKANKMFRVERGGNMKDLYKSSLHLSDYIRRTITKSRESVWIAQRGGRTKDGKDKTDQGLIKMLCMSCRDDKIAALSELHIVPVAVAYEWEPCDILKALELYESQFAKYTKKPGEDLNSILTGIMQQKGRVRFEVCEPIAAAELESLSPLTNNDYHKEVAHIIDRRIISAYRLFPNNYIAYDIRYGTSRYCNEYTAEEKARFESRLRMLDKYTTCDMDRLCDIFLGIYSNPIVSKRQLLETAL